MRLLEAKAPIVPTGLITPEQVKQIRPAEPPRAVSRPQQDSGKPKSGRLKKSTFLGMLLYLQKSGQLSEDQERYLLRLQGTVQEQELLAAIELLRHLVASPRSAARAKQDLEAARQRCPRLQAKSVLPERRRIGVGYRDKGSLRPSARPSEVPGRMWWSDDLHPALLPKFIPEEPRWITAEELFGTEGYEILQELALRAVLTQTLNYLPTTRNPKDPS